MKKYLFLPLLLLAASAHAENNGNENTTGNESETTGITILAPRDSVSSQTPKILRDMKPTMKFGGYIIGKFNWRDEDHTEENGGFDLRFLRPMSMEKSIKTSTINSNSKSTEHPVRTKDRASSMPSSNGKSLTASASKWDSSNAPSASKTPTLL